jgi:hypothetical protein
VGKRDRLLVQSPQRTRCGLLSGLGSALFVVGLLRCVAGQPANSPLSPEVDGGPLVDAGEKTMGSLAGTCEIVERRSGSSKLRLVLTATCPTDSPLRVEVVRGTPQPIELRVLANLPPRERRQVYTDAFALRDDVYMVEVVASAYCNGDVEAVAERLSCK